MTRTLCLTEYRPPEARLRRADVDFLLGPGRRAGAASEGAHWSAYERDHRAIGVVYRPSRERWGNYVATRLADRYDAFCHLDRTTALTPLHGERADTAEEETWPTGL